MIDFESHPQTMQLTKFRGRVIIRFIVHYMGRRAASVCSPLVREGDYTSKWLKLHSR
jgi:hypothetical protein